MDGRALFEPTVFHGPGSWLKAGFHCHTVQSDGGLSPDETELWDMVLGRGKRIWGVAGDDAHLNPRKRHFSDAGKAWVGIWAAAQTPAAVLAALNSGAFYSTQSWETPRSTCPSPRV